MSHPLAIITVVYKNYTVLQDFFNSLQAQTDQNFRLYIVDLSEKPEQITPPPFPHSIGFDKNLGYAHGVNVSLKQALAENMERFCVVNDDTVIHADFVKNLQAAFDNYPGSLIGGKIYYAPGYEYHKERYTQEQLGKVIWYAGGILDWNHVYTLHRGVDEVDTAQYNISDKTEFITGCCLSFDKQAFDKIGFWDESYFLYYEDADFCERAKKKNIPLYYIPSLMLWHKNAQSTDGSGSMLHQKFQYYNRIKFGLKYAPLRTKLHLVKNYIADMFTKPI